MSLSGLAALHTVVQGSSTVPLAPAPNAQVSYAQSVGVGTSAPTVTNLSDASQLMSRLNQLAQESPSKFKAVTSTIASQLSSRAASEKQEYARRGALEAELAQVQRMAAAASGGTPAAVDSSSSARDALIGAFSSASSTGSLGASASATVTNWSESGLASGLAEALALVNQALGIPP